LILLVHDPHPMRLGQSINGNAIKMSKRIDTVADGPLINGRPALTIAECKEWARAAHAPALGDSAASELTGQINHAAFLRCMWAPEFAEQRKANQSTSRLRRIAAALATLRDELPGLLADNRAVNPNADVSLTEQLLDLVGRHQAIADKYSSTRGRPRSPAKNLEANISKLLATLCKPSRVTMKARDIFVQLAMSWLTQGYPTDAAISRNRRRRAQQQARRMG
jgi:hypothetical protein